MKSSVNLRSIRSWKVLDFFLLILSFSRYPSASTRSIALATNQALDEKKVFFISLTTKRGMGGKGRTTKKMWPLSTRVGGGRGLSGRASLAVYRTVYSGVKRKCFASAGYFYPPPPWANPSLRHWPPYSCPLVYYYLFANLCNLTSLFWQMDSLFGDFFS